MDPNVENAVSNESNRSDRPADRRTFVGVDFSAEIRRAFVDHRNDGSTGKKNHQSSSYVIRFTSLRFSLI